jgi:hypothetical protein
MKVTLNVPASRALLGAASQGLVAINREVLRQTELPRLYDSGVRYEPEKRHRERWQNALEVFGAGKGDCEDLAAWRVAELQLRGEPAAVKVVRTGPRRFHAIVRRGDGSYEDPSKVLGMGRKGR